ncbi:MAG: MBL fold metallo-hydrolase [Myxococcales bacterium]|nr:MAG: MBL fold metallo-hydrolase [Myxococcales bacterium]
MSQTKIHRIEGSVMAVNSYLVESSSGVVVVDGMLTMTDARAVRRAIDQLAKPVLGGIVTHAHPDHYAGFAELLRGLDVPLFATSAVRRTIERDDAVKNAIVGPMMGDEWPKQRVFPDHEVAPGTDVVIGNLRFTVEDAGGAESPADSLWRLDERTLFVGDLVYSGMHAYLADGYATEWLTYLGQLEQRLPERSTLYVGHGEPGGTELIAAQKRYVSTFVAAVEKSLTLPESERTAAVVAEMKRLLPTDALAFLMELSVAPFAAKLLGA